MLKFKVPDMSCAHCVQTIETAIKKLDSQAVVACDLGGKEVSVTSDLDAKRIKDALAEVGYESEAAS